jgi:hypothetical protein
MEDPFLIDEDQSGRTAGEMHRNPEAEWWVTIRGTCVEVHVRKPVGFVVQASVRTHCGPFTKASRLRLIRKLNMLDWRKIGDCIFVTLTYPDPIIFERKAERNKHRYKFVRYLESYLGKQVGIVWRLEWKVRKSGYLKGTIAPHFHLLILDVKHIHYAYINEWWKKSIGYDDHPSTDVTAVTGYQGALKYLAKYVSKDDYLDIGAYLNSGVELGRHWGFLRKALIPLAPVILCRKLLAAEIDTVKTLIGNVLPWYDYDADVGAVVLGTDRVGPFIDALQ